jgi:hypothetical protein
MTQQQQAEAIVKKYYLITGYKESAIMCAVTEVEAIIAENKANGVYEVFMAKWYQILLHLKAM